MIIVHAKQQPLYALLRVTTVGGSYSLVKRTSRMEPSTAQRSFGKIDHKNNIRNYFRIFPPLVAPFGQISRETMPERFISAFLKLTTVPPTTVLILILIAFFFVVLFFTFFFFFMPFPSPLYRTSSFSGANLEYSARSNKNKKREEKKKHQYSEPSECF